MKILIASGIYPPDIGGPAQYARNLYETWKSKGYDVKVAAYRWERALPPGIRHLLYFTKILRKGWNADLILVLDTWSAAVPTMFAAKLMRKKYIIRTGGDFLWESYVERTGDLVIFRDFYQTRVDTLSGKERLIYRWGGAALRSAAKVIFSTDWQRQIFVPVYHLENARTAIVENFCGQRQTTTEPDNRSFIGGTRSLKWKNLDFLKDAFESAREGVQRYGLLDIDLDTGKAVYDSFVEKIRHSYAVILTSLGDISPNMIFDAIRVGTPFILTKETGVADRVRDCALFVDPQNKKDIIDKIVWLSDPKNRAMQAQKVRRFTWVHTWEDIAREIEVVFEKIAG
ncbi:MAG: glycosyltransferase family 4 protein [Patescibacteria group bacterium]|nr:glycosyltransferase family 4 protein [Patescibacteria group bacterium]